MRKETLAGIVGGVIGTLALVTSIGAVKIASNYAKAYDGMSNSMLGAGEVVQEYNPASITGKVYENTFDSGTELVKDKDQ
tara:strand:- start:700 stop:939 length:240 start_codon:yes stop_codon:yes gene_type:complete